MRTSTKVFVLVGLLVAAVVAVLLSTFASDEPDGLEKVAAEQGFEEAAEEHNLRDSPAADYASPVARLGGVVVTFGIGAGVFALARRRRTDAAG